jgi:hypothetical protein
MMNSIMNNKTDIERIVMRRVHLIRILQLVISTAIFATLAFIAALWGIGREVWVARVFSNGPQDFSGHAEYLFYAFLHTRLIVQALIILTLVSLIFLVREIARLTLNFFAPSRA